MTKRGERAKAVCQICQHARGDHDHGGFCKAAPVTLGRVTFHRGGCCTCFKYIPAPTKRRTKARRKG